MNAGGWHFCFSWEFVYRSYSATKNPVPVGSYEKDLIIILFSSYQLPWKVLIDVIVIILDFILQNKNSVIG